VQLLKSLCVSVGGFFPQGIAGNTDVDNINGTVTTDSCASSGALSASSLSAFVPLLVASIAVVCGVLYH